MSNLSFQISLAAIIISLSVIVFHIGLFLLGRAFSPKPIIKKVNVRKLKRAYFCLGGEEDIGTTMELAEEARKIIQELLKDE